VRWSPYALAAALALTTGLTLAAQTLDMTAAEFAALRTQPLPAEAAGGSEDLVIRVPDAVSPTAPRPVSAPALPLLARTALPIAAVRERDPQLSSERLVVIAFTPDGTVADWRVAADPRIVRAEQPDQTGLLSGQVLRRTGADLHVTIAMLPSISQIRVYQPRWNGAAFDLELVGSVDVRR